MISSRQTNKAVVWAGFKAGRRKSPGIPVFVTMFAALILSGAERSWALPVGFGTSCVLNGSTSAEQGNPGLLSNDVHTFAGGCGSGQATSTGRVDVPVQTISGLNLYRFTQNAVASATATASLGSLGVYAASQADSAPAAFLYTTTANTGGIAENLYVDNAYSSATSYWYDLITVGGTPNANGFVVLQFAMDLHGSASASLADAASASIASRFFIDDGTRYFSEQILGLFEPGTTADTIGFRPGQTIQMYGDVTANTTALAGQKYVSVCSGFLCQQAAVGYFPNSNAVADAANTAGFHVNVVTPGGSYSSLSGQSYLATPVPATVWLCATWILGLIGVARRAARAARIGA